MNFKPIIIVAGEPNSVFLEIFFKAIKNNIKNPIILIASYKILKMQMKKLKFRKKIRLLDYKIIEEYLLDNKSINLVNINYNQKKAFTKISNKSNSYINKSFSAAFKIINSGFSNKLINGPISKKYFLKKKYLGVTEYISEKYKVKNPVMLIFNKNLSVCPITTHLPLKNVAKKINKKSIEEKVKLIDKFYKKIIGLKPKIGVVGLNPHCESIATYNEDEKIIKPAINNLKKFNINVSGPYPADTCFLKNNRKNYNVIVGMYHDQVLTPMKTLFEYDAINLTLGLPFLRLSPDHGPNEKMVGKNISNPQSLIKAIKFLDNN